MTSEIRTNSLKSRAGLSTVTLTDTGPMFSGITTFVDNSTFSVGTGGTIHAPATNTLNIGVNNTESLRIDSNKDILNYLSMINYYNLPIDYLNTFVKKISSISKKDIINALQNEIDINKMTTLVVGNEKAKK